MKDLDRVRLEIHCEQNAYKHFGGPLGFSEEDAERYTSESWPLCDRYTLPVTWPAVREIVQRRPEVLTSTEQQRQQWAAERRATAEGWEREAIAAVKVQDWGAAFAALDRAELADPEFRPSGGRRTLEGVRKAIAAEAKRARTASWRARFPG